MATITQQEETISTLQTMFASLDREIILAVLQANKYQPEKTIDALLSMSNEDNISNNLDNTNVPTAPEAGPVGEGVDLAQLQKDEEIAMKLQNELFTEEDTSTSNHTDDIGLNINLKEKINQISEAARAKYREFMTRIAKKDTTPSEKKLEFLENSEKSADPTSDRPLIQSNGANDVNDDDESGAYNGEQETSPKLVDRRMQRRLEKANQQAVATSAE